MRQRLLAAFAIAVLLSGAGWAQVTKGEISGVRNYSRVDATVGCGGAVWMIKRALQDGWALDRARTEAEAIGLRSEALVTFATDYIAKHR